MDTPDETPDDEINHWRLRALVAEQKLREARRARGPSDVKRVVAQHFELLEADLVGTERSSNIVLARHLAMYLCRQLFNMSFPEIAAAFGGRDHTTAIHAVRKITSQRKDEILGAGLRAHTSKLLAMLDPKLEAESAPQEPSGHEDPGRTDPGL